MLLLFFIVVPWVLYGLFLQWGLIIENIYKKNLNCRKLSVKGKMFDMGCVKKINIGQGFHKTVEKKIDVACRYDY